MNETVDTFYSKSPDYAATYDQQHGARLDAMIETWNLSSLKGQKVLDVGGGLGFLGKRLDPSNDYWVIDGAETKPEQRVVKGHYIKADLDHDTLETGWVEGDGSPLRFDVAFILETIEHLGNPHHCLAEIKKLVKIGGEIIISYPTETVWHNVPYCGLLWPRQNFEQFLGQMALDIRAFWEFQPKPNGGWPAYHYRCVNRPWSEKRMAFPKTEAKFLHATALEMGNL